MKRIHLLLFLAAGLLSSSPLSAEGFLKGKILRLSTGSRISEQGGSDFGISLSGISTGNSISLLSVERALEKAAEDDNIALVYLNTDHFSAGMAAAEEIRAGMVRCREKGKPVVAYGTSFGNGSYYLASAADRVFMNPKGDGTLSGLSSTQMFLKDLLDTLGVEIQLIRHGKFKSAGEMYIRNDISPENRLQYEKLLGSIWSSMVCEMSSSRGLEPDSLMTWIDRLEPTAPKDWEKYGLVDGLKYRDEMEQYLCHLFGTKDPSKLSVIGIDEYAGKVKNKGPRSKKVAVIYADGEIVRSGGSSDIVGETLSREIAKVRADSSVKAVVFRVNSPGGEVVAADMIRREIELLKKDKPVVASYGSYAASGGYLISAGCDSVFTDNSTLTGSIGVFGMIPSYGDAVKKHLHVNMVPIGTNVHSSMGSGIAPLSEEETAWYQNQIEGIYDDFVGVVCDGRGMTYDEVDALAQGRVWAGKDALEIGLADRRGTILDAIECAASLAGLDSYRLATYPEKKDPLKEFLSSGKEDKKPPLVKSLKPGFNAVARMDYFYIDPIRF